MARRSCDTRHSFDELTKNFVPVTRRSFRTSWMSKALDKLACDCHWGNFATRITASAMVGAAGSEGGFTLPGTVKHSNSVGVSFSSGVAAQPSLLSNLSASFDKSTGESSNSVSLPLSQLNRLVLMSILCNFRQDVSKRFLDIQCTVAYKLLIFEAVISPRYGSILLVSEVFRHVSTGYIDLNSMFIVFRIFEVQEVCSTSRSSNTWNTSFLN
jgi:hypothetical protein